MIGHLRGQVLRKQAPLLLLEVQGVGYEVEATMATFFDMPNVGGDFSLFTHLVVSDWPWNTNRIHRVLWLTNSYIP